MFGIFRKKHHSMIESGVLMGATDIHSHILPRVDDGSPDYVTSLKLLNYLKQLGFQEVWFTPHTMEDLPMNTADYLKAGLNEFKGKFTGTMKLNISSEYMLDSGFLPKLAEKQVLPLGHQQKHLLVETSYYCAPENLYEILAEIRNQGFIPIIAHPERYMYMEWEDLVELKDQGFDFQMNLNSLSGYYGKRELDFCQDLLYNKMYNYIGTDLHHLGNYSSYLESIEEESDVLDGVAELFQNNKLL